MRCFILWQLVFAISAAMQSNDLTAAAKPSVVPTATPGNLHVVIIGGINKDPEEIRSKDKTVTHLAAYFRNTVGVSASSLFILTQADSFVKEHTGISDAATIKNTLTELASQHSKATTIIYYTGQANLVGDQLRFNIPGPDMTHEEFGALIKAFGDAHVCVVLDCPGAGLAAKVLAGPNRILVFAARSDQPTSTRFSDYFVPALTDSFADVNGDGQVSLVEAFQLAVQQIDATFRDQGMMKSETALLDDNGDGVPSQHPWAPGEEGKDGDQAMRLSTATWTMIGTNIPAAETSVQPPTKADKP